MIDLKKLNTDEKEAIIELQKRVSDVCPKEYVDEDGALIYRFLKARDFNVDKAEKMLRKHLIWRRANQVNNLFKEYKTKEVFLKYLQPTNLGFDKDGDLIYYEPLGKIDARDVTKCLTVNELIRTSVWFLENVRSILVQNSDKEKQLYLQVNVVIDLEELTFFNATNKASAEILTRILHVLQDNYPEGMKSILVINAPSYYVFIWSILKVFMSQAMIQKIQICGYSGWEEKILQKIDADVLPSFLGGSRTDPDGNPLCKTTVMHGGKIPPSYHITNEDRGFRDRSRVKQLTVHPSSVAEVCVEVREDGSEIRWEILIQGKDVGFGLFYEDMNKRKEILPIQRIDSIDGVESSYYRTKLAGKYVFVFDNGYSWLNTKEIEYCITLN